MIKRIKSATDFDKIFSICSSVCLGMGLFIVLMQALGILGLLNESYVTALLILGYLILALNIRFLSVKQISSKIKFKFFSFFSKEDLYLKWLLILIAVYLFLRPLGPPIEWDEVMYHLPHARDWVMAGKLKINEWLRYPLFPYNFNLIYAVGLIYRNDIFPHMVHSLSGWLVAIGLYRLAVIYFNRFVAGISVFLFIVLAGSEFSNAYIDLGLTLFVFFSLAYLYIWFKGGSFDLLCLSVFFLGVAVGAKYQALLFVPFVAVVILQRERQFKKWVILLGLFLLPCFYWYARNFYISGDPFHPLGAALFGYWGWDEQDMQIQLRAMHIAQKWPHLLIWLSVAALFIRSKYSYSPFRAASIFTVYALITWGITSRYPRYLLPAYPAIALLGAIVIEYIFKDSFFIKSVKSSANVQKLAIKAFSTLPIVFLVLLTITVMQQSVLRIREIQSNPVDRAMYLSKKIKSFEIGEFLRDHSEYRVVQIELESDLYYLPSNTIGDHFGPGRYRNFLDLSSPELAKRLGDFNANAILLPNRVNALKIIQQPDFGNYFSLVMKTPEAALYSLKDVSSYGDSN